MWQRPIALRRRRRQDLGDRRVVLEAPTIPERPAATVSEHVASHLAGGYPEVTADRFENVTGNPEHGGEVDVRGPDEAVVARILWDSDEARGHVYAATASDLERPLEQLVAERLASALERRRELGLLGEDQAYRLVNAEGDGLPGLTLDVYGRWLVLGTVSSALSRAAEHLVRAAREQLQPAGIIEMLRPRKGGKDVKSRVHGEPPPRRMVVREGDWPYEVHLRGGGPNTGLFVDLRLERRRLAEIAAGKRALHTFSYSGALTAALARGGVAHVTLLDLAPGMHDWAKRNLELAGFDTEASEAGKPAFRFEQVDVLERLTTLHKAGERFDLVLLDPPTYSARRPSAWSLKRQLPELVTAGARLTPDPGGTLWLATTSRAHRLPVVERMVEEGLAASGRQGTITARRGLPPEFPTLECYPRGQYLKVLEVAVAPLSNP